jgi:ketosteroid isomerase-like protein
MKNSICSLFVLLATVASSASPVGPDISKIFATWNAGYEAKDLNKVLSIYTKDLKYSFQGEPDLDYDGLKASYFTDFQSRHPKWTWTSITESVQVDSKLAVAISRWTCYEETPGGTPKVTVKIRSIDLLRPTPDGWKIFHTINYPEP